MFASLINKSASFFVDMSLEEAGYNCQECKDKGCCPICRSPPCDGGMIVCSDRTCKKWYHYQCENLTDEFVATVKAYYCVACRQKNPKRKIVKHKKSEIEKILKELNSQKSVDDNPKDEDSSSDLSSNNADASSDFSENGEKSGEASINNDSSDTSSNICDNGDLSGDSTDKESSEKPSSTEISPINSIIVPNSAEGPLGSFNSQNGPRVPVDNNTGIKEGGPSALELESALDSTFPNVNTQINKIEQSLGLLSGESATFPPERPLELNINKTLDSSAGDYPVQIPEGEQGPHSHDNIGGNQNDLDQPSEKGLESD